MNLFLVFDICQELVESLFPVDYFLTFLFQQLKNHIKNKLDETGSHFSVCSLTFIIVEHRSTFSVQVYARIHKENVAVQHALRPQKTEGQRRSTMNTKRKLDSHTF